MDSISSREAHGRPRCRPKRLGADTGYSYPRIRRALRRRSIQAVIPQRSDQARNQRGRPLHFDKKAYRERHAVERRIGWLKEDRRLGTPYEKPATPFLTMLPLGFVRRYLENELPDRA